ncbi:MAG: hypothetical protein OEY66_07265 [Gammaproteobacteria bacterium]|nr:hypothetical protein [Gammaproteobacteria bacterium]
MSIVIIYGKQASGKTADAKQLQKFYGCKSVVDEWDGSSFIPDEGLAITSCMPPFNINGAAVIHITVAIDHMNRTQAPA